MRALAGASARAPRSSVARAGGGVLVVIVLLFVAYAFLAPATYRATAIVEVQRVPNGKTPWPEPLQAAARLRARLLDRELLVLVARSESATASGSARALRERIGASLRVESDDARRFTISSAASNAEAARRISNEFARNATSNASSILGAPDDSSAERLRASFVPAPLPSLPERPNRLLVIVMGLTIGTVWGTGVMLFLQLWRTRGQRQGNMLPEASVTELDPAPLSSPQSGAVRELVAEVLRPKAPHVTPARISAQPVSVGWQPHVSVDPAARRTLCDEILPFVADGCFVIGVTAVPEVDAHKSRIALELAFAMVAQGQPRVLLLEADFHSPGVHRAMGFRSPTSDGFSDQLRARVHDEGDRPWRVIDCGRSLHVILEGSTGSAGMLLSNQFGEAIRSLRTYYDVIVLNGPPTSNELDCRVLEAVVDGVAVVSTSVESPYLSPALAIFKRKRFSKTVSI